MPTKVGYPKICIGSKADLAKRLSYKGFPKEKSLELINDVLKNSNRYWKDNLKRSKPEEEKWVRSAKGKPLGALLGKIDQMILAPHDGLIPGFIFGGRRNSSHVNAVVHLQGEKRKRTLLKLDLRRFFEQISQERVVSFLSSVCGCSYKGAKLIANFCCVPVGKKNSGNQQKTIARGFATSSRLAVWCSIDLFKQLDRLVQTRLKGREPKIAIYIDDIGVTATNTKKAEMLKLSEEIRTFVEGYKRPLYLNNKKTEITRHDEGMEHLGIRMNKRSLSLGAKSRSNKAKLINKLKITDTTSDRNKIKERLAGIRVYERSLRLRHQLE